jgi:6-pyruvoyltetrahydropterin/6-carboxytetrahydropterin synthase
MPASLTRTVRFQSRHHYWMAEWPPERNRSTFGPLAEPHAHHYACAVTVSGPMDPRTGMLVDLRLLDRILVEEVLTPLDQKDLNREVPAFSASGSLPTCESLALWIFRRVAARLPAGVRLERVRVDEDPTLHAECTGLD